MQPRRARRVQARAKAPYLVTGIWLAAAVAAWGTRAGGRTAGRTTHAAVHPRTVTASRHALRADSRSAARHPAAPPDPPSPLTTADNGATVRRRLGQRMTVAL